MSGLSIQVANFFFTSTLNTALGGLSNIAGTFQTIAYSILAATFLMGVYEALLTGGSFQKFGTTVLKFGVAAAVIAYWPAFFSDVVNTGMSIATTVLGGGTDAIQQWGTDLNTYMQSNSLSSLASSGLSALAISAVFVLIVLVTVVIFFACLKLFTLIFLFWGGVLYCMGPMMIALSPSGLVGSYAGQYCRSLAEWSLWPVLYAVFATLMVALPSNTVSSLTSANNSSLPVAVDQSTSNTILLALTSLLYGLCMIFIPFIAHFLIKGDFGGAAVGVMKMARQAASLASGGGAAAAASPSAASSTSGGGSGLIANNATPGGGGGVGSSTSMPPSPTPTSSPSVMASKAPSHSPSAMASKAPSSSYGMSSTSSASSSTWSSQTGGSFPSTSRISPANSA